MKTIARTLLFVVLFPMWLFWLLLDIATHGTNYREWGFYSVFFD